MLPLNANQTKQQYQQALALIQAKRFDAAMDILVKLAVLRPELAEVPFQQGKIAVAQKDHAAAAAFYATARALKPTEPAILTALAASQSEAQSYTEASATFDALIALAPKAIKPRADKALMLQRAGQFDAAEKEFRKALKLAPLDGELYRIFLATKKLKSNDPLIRAMKTAWADKRVAGRSRAHLGFALSKTMEDTGNYKRVFSYLRPANTLIRAQNPYDLSQRDAEVKALLECYAGFDFCAPGPVKTEAFAPIFVAGLPRSGTTLVEQVLASHPDVTGGGEMGHGLKLAYDLLGSPGTQLRQIPELKPEDLQGFANAYQSAVRTTLTFDARMTDKSIQTHLIMGLIRQAIPSARFVVVRRDPRDIAYSIYKNVFGPGSHRYAYDLSDIARYIQTHDQMLDFWQSALPGGFHEIWYEDLVNDPEPQARALLKAVDLPWNDACLRFYDNPREVRTLSVHQVRQPIYKTSAAGWRRYANELRPVSEALGLKEND
jgi:tetratricopeptide (TPR) repeat protein